LKKNYISPFINTYIKRVEIENKFIVVVVIQPSKSLPHVFIKDIDNKNKGDIYVRRGTITEKAEPSDYQRFFSTYIESLKIEIYNVFNGKLSTIDKKIGNLEKSLIKPDQTNQNDSSSFQQDYEKNNIYKSFENLGLLEKIDFIFINKHNYIKKDLLEEAKKILEYLQSKKIDFYLENKSQDKITELLNELNDISETYWLALTKILLNDDEELLSKHILNSIDALSYNFEPLMINGFTPDGLGIRYYPLVVSLYLIFIIGFYTRKTSLLKKCSDLELRPKSSYLPEKRIYDALFLLRYATNLFKTQHHNYPSITWCEPVSEYIKLILEQRLRVDEDIFDFDKHFIIGEFILSLLPLDVNYINEENIFYVSPASGLYLYYSSSVNYIKHFLRKEREWLKNIFNNRDLKEILSDFDNKAGKLHINPFCTRGFIFGALQSAYPIDNNKNE
jgi:hypothetical protein